MSIKQLPPMSYRQLCAILRAAAKQVSNWPKWAQLPQNRYRGGR